MKRWLAAVVIMVVAINLAGCDSVQRKFTRKKKTVKAPRIVQEQKYVKKPSPELYEKHFAYWQSWSSEILQDLGDNRKKDRQCIEQIIGQVNDMKNILIPSKGDELAKHIKRYEEVRDIINREELSQYNKSFVLTTLDREDRLIKNEFCISKVKNYLKKSFTPEEGGPALVSGASVQVTPSAPAPVITTAQSQVAAGPVAAEDTERVPDNRVVQEDAK
jgi:hypothetical protein